MVAETRQGRRGGAPGARSTNATSVTAGVLVAGALVLILAARGSFQQFTY